MAITNYHMADGTVVKVGDRIRVVTEGTVTDIASDHIDYQAGNSEAAAVYPKDGEFVSLEVLPPQRPEVKPGQVWESRGIQLFVTTSSRGEPLFMASSTGFDGVHAANFSEFYPDAKLVFDPEAAHA